MIVHAWAVIFTMMALCVWQPLFILVAIPIIGARQLGLAIIMHEAAHGGVSKNPKLNDFLGLWLAGAPIGGSLKSYRPYHLQHHKFTQQPEDPDLGLSAPFPITKHSLRRKIFRDLTGQTFYKQRLNQIANALGLNLRKTGGAENRATTAREAVIPFLLTNLLLLIGLTLAGAWWVFFILWLLPLATW
ncbi:MAG: fatty acid desaturase, partial [Henriciella sp.]